MLWFNSILCLNLFLCFGVWQCKRHINYFKGISDMINSFAIAAKYTSKKILNYSQQMGNKRMIK